MAHKHRFITLPCGHQPDIRSIKPIAISNEILFMAFEMSEETSEPKLEEARLFFDKMMQKTQEKLSKFDLEDDPEDCIIFARDTYEETIKGSWQSFRSGESPLGFTFMYQPLLDDARKDFEEDIKLAIDEHLSGYVSNKDKKECLSKLRRAVNKYAEWASSVFDSFDEVMQKLLRGAIRDFQKSPRQQKKEQQQSTSKFLKTAEVPVKKIEEAAKQEEEEDDDSFPELVEVMDEEVQYHSTLGSVIDEGYLNRQWVLDLWTSEAQNFVYFILTAFIMYYVLFFVCLDSDK